MSTRPSPIIRLGLVALALTTALAAGVNLQMRLDGLVAWLLAANAVTFLAYGYDKWVAGSHLTRVPERVLLVMALAGGTLGALLGMRAFHHKTAKESFRFKFWLVVVAQLAVVAGYYWLAWRHR